jgi:4-hydroxy-tetrahydrodipicolinate reductase
MHASGGLKLLILGRGKTGALVAEVARERNHNGAALGSAENQHASGLTAEALAKVDMVIDFTTPVAVLENIAACARHRVSMVVGTTGWQAEMDRVRELVRESGIGFCYGSNFSLGVNIFFRIAEAASAAVPNGYAVRIMERHHAQKKDAPSGTAVTLRRLLNPENPQSIDITSLREGDAVGQHVIFLDSENDTMMLVHDAKSRRGFAEGAVRAAEWLRGKRGFFEFKDLLQELGRP